MLWTTLTLYFKVLRRSHSLFPNQICYAAITVRKDTICSVISPLSLTFLQATGSVKNVLPLSTIER